MSCNNTIEVDKPVSNVANPSSCTRQRTADNIPHHHVISAVGELDALTRPECMTDFQDVPLDFFRAAKAVGK